MYPQPDLQQKIKEHLSDTSALMREAAVDLVGRSLLSRPGLLDMYYDMLCDRAVVCCTCRCGVKHMPRSHLSLWTNKTSKSDI